MHRFTSPHIFLSFCLLYCTCTVPSLQNPIACSRASCNTLSLPRRFILPSWRSSFLYSSNTTLLKHNLHSNIPVYTCGLLPNLSERYKHYGRGSSLAVYSSTSCNKLDGQYQTVGCPNPPWGGHRRGYSRPERDIFDAFSQHRHQDQQFLIEQP
jgi:hypothetical protein